MTPTLPLNKICFSDALAFMYEVPNGVIDATVTSPPGWRKRRTIDPAHKMAIFEMGQEPQLDCYLAAMRAVFEQVHRATKPSGTLWLHVPDTRATAELIECSPELADHQPGELIGMPDFLVREFRKVGWHLVSEIIWDQTNANHKAAKLRPSDSHEKILLFAKSEDFYFDWFATREVADTQPALVPKYRRCRTVWECAAESVAGHHLLGFREDTNTYLERNLACEVHGRTPRVSAGALFDAVAPPVVCTCKAVPHDVRAATPAYIVERCILGGTSEAGCCPACGAPLARIVNSAAESVSHRGIKTRVEASEGWEMTCKCKSIQHPTRSLVCDPFTGSGTTLTIAAANNRDFIGSELDPHFVAKIAPARIAAARR